MEVKITYETLFDSVRKEKGSQEIQALDEDFYDEVNKYLSEKIRDYSSTQDNRLFTQIHNIKKIVRELFEIRQKKVLMMAFSQGRTKKELATQGLLKEESFFFDNIMQTITKFNSLLEKTFIENNETQKPAKPVEPIKTTVTDLIKVKFLTNLPKFLGKDLESYGPFSKGDLAELPEQLANILINKSRAEKP